MPQLTAAVPGAAPGRPSTPRMQIKLTRILSAQDHHLLVLERYVDGGGGGHVGGVAVGGEGAGVVNGEIGVAEIGQLSLGGPAVGGGRKEGGGFIQAGLSAAAAAYAEMG